jgi:hypothetical protein
MTREPRSNVTGGTGQFPFPDFSLDIVAFCTVRE